MREYLFVLKPELLLEWDYEKNAGVDVTKVTKSSHKKYWWKCNKGCGNHSWETNPATRFRGSGCVICCNPSRQICSCGCNSLLTMFPDIACEWDYDQNKDENGDPISPDMVMPGSGYLADWVCTEGCGNHRYKQYVYQRTGKQKNGCPICCVPSKTVCPCGCNSLAQKFPDICEMWDYDKNNQTFGENITPKIVTTGSTYNIWWKCNKGCGNHSWQSLISNITKQKRVNECPICADIRVCPCGCNSLATKYPNLMMQWNHKKIEMITIQY
jgi:hypothetical protein